MPRPIKWRRVGSIPEVTYFKPAGIPRRFLDEICLSVEEVEALRLKDSDGLQQEECAEKMHVSRPTFHRVLESARGKIADALINGKAIRIEGGSFEMMRCRFRCGWDGHEWNVPKDEAIANDIGVCPKCRRSNVTRVDVLMRAPGRRGCGRGQGWKRWQSEEAEHVEIE